MRASRPAAGPYDETTNTWLDDEDYLKTSAAVVLNEGALPSDRVEALYNAFDWNTHPLGGSGWYDLALKIQRREPIPPLVRLALLEILARGRRGFHTFTKVLR